MSGISSLLDWSLILRLFTTVGLLIRFNNSTNFIPKRSANNLLYSETKSVVNDQFFPIQTTV